MKFIKQESLAFQDVLLEPQHFDGTSRSEIDISTELCGLKLDIPILGANMAAIMSIDMAIALSRLGCLPVLHRMCPNDVQVIMAQEIKDHIGNAQYIAGSFGTQDGWKNHCKELSKYVDILCLDVAHADQKKVIETVKEFREEYGDFPLIIGNFATPDGILRMLENDIICEHAESTAFKVGVGGGSLCTTRVQTGCGVPTFQSGLDCQELIENGVQIILDGGIQNSGDIVKCLALGTKAVMVGSLIAATEECPGNVIKGLDGKKYKLYYGNASYMTKGKAKHIEGEETLMPYKGPVERIIRSLAEGIRSGLSYCGAHNLNELYSQAIFRRITNASWTESLPHGKI